MYMNNTTNQEKETQTKSMASVISEQWDHVVVNISGGKDSSALMQWVADHFKNHPSVHYVHASIDIDWKETHGVVCSQCEHFNVKPIFVQAVFADGSPKGFLSKLTAPRTDRKTGEIKENQFPDMCNRWCTSELKQAPIHKWIRNNLQGKILNLMGERAEESRQRAALTQVRFDEKLSTGSREVWNCSPIHSYTETQVWDVIHANKIPVHPCYGWGVKRASCAICIFSSNEDIRIAAQHAPEIVAQYIEAEAKIQHTFRYKAATKKNPERKETIASILASTK